MNLFILVGILTKIVHFIYNTFFICYKNDPPTCSRIIDNSEYTSVKDINKIHEYYNSYNYINYHLCSMTDVSVKKIVCPQFNKNERHNLDNYKNGETIINNIYYRINTICNSKTVFFENKDVLILNTIDKICINFVEKDFDYTYHIIRILAELVLIIILYYMSFKIYIYKRRKNKNIDHYTNIIKSINDECSICYDNYNEDEYIREIKTCKHKFHKNCIHQWIVTYNNDTCPNCRQTI